MKRIFVFFLSVLAISGFSTARAQYISIGPVASFGHSWVSNVGGNTRFNPSGSLGVGMIYSRQNNWGFGADLALSFEGLTKDELIDGTTYTVKVRPLYLRIPLKVYYFFGDYGDNIRPKVYLGPTLGFKLDEINDVEPYSTEARLPDNFFRSFDLGLQAGAGANFKISGRTWLNLDLGYYVGLLDAVDAAADNYNMNQNLRLNVGVLFGLR